MRIKRYLGVTAAVGLPGSGKSYYLAEQALKAQRRGVPVYSNAGFDVKGTEPIRSFEDFAQLQGPAVVVWDELPLYFNARRWADFPDGMLYKLTQIRKDSIQLYYSTIHEMLVDTVLRRLTFAWIEHRHMFGRLVRRTYWPPREFRTEGHTSYRKEIVVMRQRVMDAYDTMGRVQVHDASRLETMPSGTWSKPVWAGDGSRLRVSPASSDNGQGRHAADASSEEVGT